MSFQTLSVPALASNSALSPRARPVLQRKCACGGTPGPTGECQQCKRKRLALQSKLTINQPGDRYEQEADHVADAVVKGIVPKEGSKRQREETPLQCKTPNESATASVAPSIVDDVLAESGQPLDAATRGFMEERFGYDFGRVRVHRDARASESARAVSAHAYTVGHHLVFDAGRYAPETHAGQRLLAHELAHVVQQSSSASPGLQRDDKPPAERVDVAHRLQLDDDTLDEMRPKLRQDSASGHQLRGCEANSWRPSGSPSGRSMSSRIPTAPGKSRSTLREARSWSSSPSVAKT